MATHHDVVIVGAGHAGAQAAIALRQRKFQGTIALVGDEPDLPYERPPLSKDYMTGEKPFERLLIRPAGFWRERAITLLPATRIVAVDADAHRVTAADGTVLAYDHLVWATGGTPRRLSCAGGDLAGVHTVRNRADVDRLMAELPAVAHAVVIGGGYIGLEASAALVKAGKAVTVLEAQDRVLARVAGEPLSRFYEEEHRARGVDVRLNSEVDIICGRDGRVTGVRLSTGEVLGCEMVIVGIGILPAVAPLLAAGATAAANGVWVDACCRTSLSNVLAIGDCAAHANLFAGGETIRLESVQNANDQAKTAVSVILEEPVEYCATPWFWSNQYDLRLQTVGLSMNANRMAISGDIGQRSFAITYFRNGFVVAVDAVNDTKSFVAGRRAVEALKTSGGQPDFLSRSLGLQLDA